MTRMVITGRYIITVMTSVFLASCGGGSGNNAAQFSPPSKPVISIGQQWPWPGKSVTFTASSSDPHGEAVSFAWNFDDGVTATGASVSHAYAAEGTFSVRVTATNTDNVSSSNVLSLSVAYPAPTNDNISVQSAKQYTQQAFALQGTATDPAGLPLTSFSWDFGDSTVGAGATAHHAYSAAGQYMVTMTVTNSAHKSSSSSVMLTVLPIPSNGSVNNTDNAFVPYCSDVLCAATDASTYAGTGIGIWRYNNTTSNDATLNIKINGVASGKIATLLFSNGQPDFENNPQYGNSVGGNLPASLFSVPAARLLGNRSAYTAMTSVYADPHAVMLERNRELALELMRKSKVNPAIHSAAPHAFDRLRPNAAPPDIGSTHTWIENYDTPVNYSTSVIYTCVLADGRNAVFWLDRNVTTAGKLNNNELNILETTYCNGGYNQLTGMLGSPWGASADNDPDLIHDQPGQLQDVNIIILQVPGNTGWGGYFYGINNYLSSTFSSSNEALAFFINGENLPGNGGYYASTLLHETTHMINFYQRAIVRGVWHDTWLEETSAMMSEDIFAHLTSSDSIDGRVSGMMLDAGGISLINWTSLSGSSYNLGGSFGAFLNRRYGPVVYKNLIECGSAVPAFTSYDCMNALIIQNGGSGFSDEFARLGASVFAPIPAAGAPWGFGFPATTNAGDASFNEFPIELSGSISTRPTSTLLNNGSFDPTSHNFMIEKNVSGTIYERDGVVVPANTTLMVVIR